MSELERTDAVLEGEVVGDDAWEAATQEWVVGKQHQMRGYLHKLRAAYWVDRAYGEHSMEEFAKQAAVQSSRTTVYQYAQAYGRAVRTYGSEEAAWERLENSPLTLSHILEAMYADDMAKVLDIAEDETKSYRQMRREREEASKPKNVEVITEIVCPACGVISNMNAVETRTRSGA